MKQKLVCFFLVFSFLFAIPFSSSASDEALSFSDNFTCLFLNEDLPLSSTKKYFWEKSNSGIYYPYCEDTIFYTSTNPKVFSLVSSCEKLGINQTDNFKLVFDVFHQGDDSNGTATKKMSYTLSIFVGANQIYSKNFDDDKIHTIKNSFNLKDLNISDINTEIRIQVAFDGYTTASYDPYIIFGFSNLSVTNTDDNTGLLENILNWLSRIYHGIIGGTDKEGVEHVGLVQGIVNGLNSLGDKIQEFFNNFADYWQNGIDNLKQGIENIITTLKNYLLYFQNPVTINSDGVPIGADGNPVYTNPFSSALENVKAHIDEWTGKIQDFVNSINFTSQNVSSYISVFTNAYERFGKGVPVVMAVISFGFVFIIIKKVVGR